MSHYIRDFILSYLFSLAFFFILVGDVTAAILLVSPNGSYVVEPTLEHARTSANCAGRTVVVTSALSPAQSNILSAWPSDRALKIERGGSIANSTVFDLTGVEFSAGLYQVFAGCGVVKGLKYAYSDWFGIVGTGDESLKVQAFLTAASGGSAVFTSPQITAAKVKIPSNINIYGWNTTIILPAAQPSLTPVLSFRGSKNVNIWGLAVDGNKHNQSGSAGEQDGGMHGISIYGGSNINLFYTSTNNCFTDGIYLKSSIGDVGSGGDPPADITIIGHTSSGNGRQGMSIISAVRLIVIDSKFVNTIGLSPEGGVDIEPNQSTDSLSDIKFIRTTITGNNGRGFVADLKGVVSNLLIDDMVLKGNLGNSSLSITGESGTKLKNSRLKNIVADGKICIQARANNAVSYLNIYLENVIASQLLLRDHATDSDQIKISNIKLLALGTTPALDIDRIPAGVDIDGLIVSRGLGAFRIGTSVGISVIKGTSAQLGVNFKYMNMKKSH